MSFLQYRERSYEDEVKMDSGRSSSAIRRTRLANGRAVSVLGQARSANGRAESVLGPTRRTAELNPRLFQLGERPS
ncbi:hypothetical protein F2Q68_00016127 [Brassica cretica]|uniref:Uncharacterized protein n=1 Tax=Brassica cretica TaxID=69181 RepID=A0A8S9HUQ3_BRACR|nr:hypothetical protein F2Q68_00016127 [Brassica cretica]